MNLARIISLEVCSRCGVIVAYIATLELYSDSLAGKVVVSWAAMALVDGNNWLDWRRREPGSESLWWCLTAWVSLGLLLWRDMTRLSEESGT